jgi:hypothetical protein
MIPLKYHTLKPIIEPHIRLIASHSGSNFGLQDNEEHLLQRLNNILESLEHPEPYEHYMRLTNVPFPDLSRERVDMGIPQFSDITLKDTARQNRSMEERFRKNLMTIQDVRKLTDTATRLHYPASRGLERRMLDIITDLDSEALNRSTIKPIIV